jgi:hypothetical protein
MFRIDEMAPIKGSAAHFQPTGNGFWVAVANIDRLRPTRDPAVCQVVLVGGMSYFAAGSLAELSAQLKP